MLSGAPVRAIHSVAERVPELPFDSADSNEAIVEGSVDIIAR